MVEKSWSAPSLSVVIGVAMFLASCTTDSNADADADTTSAPSETSAPENASGYRVVPCDEVAPAMAETFVDAGVVCGYVTVQADWEDDTAGTMDLAVYKLGATTDGVESEPILYINGGPGASGAETAEAFIGDQPRFMRAHHDVYLFDQRGTSYSKPALHCPELFDLGLGPEAMGECFARSVAEGLQPELMTSTQSASDVDAIRVALGYDSINIYGLSYGTRIALTVLRDHPAGVRSVVLDSVFPLQVNGFSDIPATKYWALNQMADYCERDEACRSEFGDLRDLVETALQTIEATPEGDLTAGGFIDDVTASLLVPELALYIQAVASETATPEQAEEFEFEADFAEDPSDPGYELSSAEGAAYTVLCSEEFPFIDQPAIADNSSQFGPLTQSAVEQSWPKFNRDWCEGWSVPAADQIENEAVHSDVPTLVLASNGDLATPPDWSRLASETLSAATYVEFDGVGHGLVSSTQFFEPNSCFQSIVTSFFSSPTAELDLACVDSEPLFRYELE